MTHDTHRHTLTSVTTKTPDSPRQRRTISQNVQQWRWFQHNTHTIPVMMMEHHIRCTTSFHTRHQNQLATPHRRHTAAVNTHLTLCQPSARRPTCLRPGVSIWNLLHVHKVTAAVLNVSAYSVNRSIFSTRVTKPSRRSRYRGTSANARYSRANIPYTPDHCHCG